MSAIKTRPAKLAGVVTPAGVANPVNFAGQESKAHVEPQPQEGPVAHVDAVEVAIAVAGSLEVEAIKHVAAEDTQGGLPGQEDLHARRQAQSAGQRLSQPQAARTLTRWAWLYPTTWGRPCKSITGVITKDAVFDKYPT